MLCSCRSARLPHLQEISRTDSFGVALSLFGNTRVSRPHSSHTITGFNSTRSFVSLLSIAPSLCCMRFASSSILRRTTKTVAMSEAKTAISISPLLLQLADPTTTLYSVTAQEVAAAVSHIFANSISPVQTGCLLYGLHTTQLDRRPDILAACASSMRYAAAQVDENALKKAVTQRGRKEGQYHGGLVWYAQATLLCYSTTN